MEWFDSRLMPRRGLLLRMQPTPFLGQMQYFLQRLPRIPQRRRLQNLLLQPSLVGCVRRALQTLSQVRLRLAAEIRNSAATQRLTVGIMT